MPYAGRHTNAAREDRSQEDPAARPSPKDRSETAVSHEGQEWVCHHVQAQAEDPRGRPTWVPENGTLAAGRGGAGEGLFQGQGKPRAERTTHHSRPVQTKGREEEIKSQGVIEAGEIYHIIIIFFLLLLLLL